MEEITAAQAATLTGFSERTIRRKIASGELRARRIAVNRFAIDVRDLPRRWNGHDVERRLEALERRVQLLEEGQRILLQRFGQEMKETGGEQAPIPAAEQDPSITTLHELLVQLAHETERLTPLFTPEEREGEQQSGQAGGRRARARLRPLPNDSADQRQES